MARWDRPSLDDESYEGFLRTWAGCYASEDIIDVIKQLRDTYTINTVRAHVTRNEIVFIDGVGNVITVTGEGELYADDFRRV